MIDPHKTAEAKHSKAFVEFAHKILTKAQLDTIDNLQLLALDPGETTGWALFNGLYLVEFGQVNTKDPGIGTTKIGELLTRVKPQHVVMEDYRVYSWMAKSHTHSNLVTPRLIGGVEALRAFAKNTPGAFELHKELAMMPKQFCNDDNMTRWGFYQLGRGLRHSRDAIRHACYYLLFTIHKHATAKVGEKT